MSNLFRDLLTPPAEIAWRTRRAQGAMAARAWLRPGVGAGEVYARCAALADRLGYAEVFMGQGVTRAPYVGHGVGIEMDEVPILGPKARTVLEAGMTIAVEPKIVFPGRGMVGIEDLFLVGEAVATPLNLTSRELIAL